MDTPGTDARIERTHTDLELALIRELDAIAAQARAGELAVIERRATTGVSALTKLKDRARDAARHGRARTLTQETTSCP